MRDDDAIAIVVVLVGGWLMMPRVDFGDPSLWTIPVPDGIVNGARYPAVVSDGWGTDRPGGLLHRGVDIMYRRRSERDRPEYPAGVNDGTGSAAGSLYHFAPSGVPIVAARAGRVWSVSRTKRGWSVVLDHGKPWATYYTHLASAFLPEHRAGVNVATGKPTNIRAGDIIGTMGHDPMDPSKLRHLHFAVWFNGGESAAVDPEHAMAKWSRVPWAFTA